MLIEHPGNVTIYGGTGKTRSRQQDFFFGAEMTLTFVVPELLQIVSHLLHVHAAFRSVPQSLSQIQGLVMIV